MTDPHLATPSGKPRARTLELPFRGVPGPANAITDVAGVEVGYATLIEGDAVRTGVTAVHPRGRADAGDPCSAGFHSFNGNGEMTGVSWIEESGTTSGPIAITNTHAIGPVHAGIVGWTTRHHPELAAAWLLPVAAETWDGYLNDINGRHVTEATAEAALDAAAPGSIEEGSVGGGTGMCCYQFKGGTGTASRVVRHDDDTYTVGVLVQANFGARRELTIAGVPLGDALADDNPMGSRYDAPPPGAGSIIALVATDAPLLPGQCKALARRVPLGIARTGTTGSHFSGDLFLAFSTANAHGFTPGWRTLHGHGRGYDQLRFIPWGFLDPLYEAVVQSVEEAILNALVANEEMVGYRGRRVPALPRERVAELVHERVRATA